MGLFGEPPATGQHRVAEAPTSGRHRVGEPNVRPHRPRVPVTSTPRAKRRAPAAPAAPAPSRPVNRAGDRILLVLLFWATLAGSVAVWWLRSDPADLLDPDLRLGALARVTGLVTGQLLLTQVVLASRMAWLENSVGSRDLLRWRHGLGLPLLLVTLAHAAVIVVPRATAQGVDVVAAGKGLIGADDDLRNAFVAAGLLAVIALTAIRVVRRCLPYGVRLLLHRGTYAVLLLGFGHQFAGGADVREGYGYWYWVGLYATALACLVWGRFIAPIWFNLRHRLRVSHVRTESPDTVSIYLTGRRLDRFGQAGQHFRWRFLTGGLWRHARPLSLSAPPDEQWLRITVRVVGRRAARFKSLRAGTRVWAYGPGGDFTPDRRVRDRALLVAVGDGIAPIRALAEKMPPDTVLVYRARDTRDVIFDRELQGLKVQRGLTVRYVTGGRKDREPRYAFSADGLRDLAPRLPERDVYLCGPPKLIRRLVRTLRRLGVPRRQIHVDPFEN
ncbi:ferredoxin reductase family protein [Pilimelia columellifera]|uniref:ferredoxin reductase family protein n=1 Tax=Pilimelia columellifera TaxID=706574 RepID=UPI0031D21BDF